MKLLYVLFLVLSSSLFTEAIANPYYESMHCIDEKSNTIGEGEISQCITNSNNQYLCPIDSVECNKNDNFDAEPPQCDSPKVFDNLVGLCSETLVNPAQCPSGSELSDNRCNGLLVQAASCPKGQTLQNDQCSVTLSQSAGCPTGYSLKNGICTATLTDTPKCPTGQSFNSTTGRCSQTLFDGAQCPSGSSLSNDRCNGLLVQNATCPSGQTLKDGVCTTTLTDTPKCPSGQTFNPTTGKCSQNLFDGAQCPSGSSLSNDRCIGSIVQNATCPLGQTLYNGSCSGILTDTPYCSNGKYDASKDACVDNLTDVAVEYCPSGYTKRFGKCEKQVQECRYNSQNYYRWGCGLAMKWDGRNVTNSQGYYKGALKSTTTSNSCGSQTQVKEYEICTTNTVTIDVSHKCEAGYSYNSSTNRCEKTVISAPKCQGGYTYNSSTNRCEKSITSAPICNSGFTFNPSSNKCEKLINATPTCKVGYTYNPTYNKCMKTIVSSPLCQSGYGYNMTTKRCEKTVNSAPICNSGYSFNPSSNKCEKVINAAPMCKQGYTYSPTHDRCMKIVTSSPFCQSGYTYNDNLKLCSKVVSTAPLCNSGYGYNLSTNRCEKVVTSAPICQSGYHYNLITDRCEREIDTDPICPTGYDFNPKSDKCEKVVTDEPQCPSGYGFNPETKQCEKSWITESCPYGSQFQCIPNGGTSFCSPNRCFDPNTEKVEEDDDIDGSMLVNNGEVNDDGICMDQVYIFSGRAQKCRTKGVQTAFKDCCKPEGKVLKDGGGSSAESELTSTTISAIYQASAAAYNAYSAGATMAEAGNAFTSGFVGAFDPTSLAISIAIAIVMDYLAKACDQIETETALANSSSMCVYVGEYCKEKWLGKCVQKAQSYCCFNSQLAKIINEQGRQQLKSFENLGAKGFGEVKNPQCRGFTPEEFQALDFSNIDLSAYYDEITHRAQSEVQETMESMTEEYFNNVN
ncbi:conjugal transfer protein TraN [Vibrio parahaemolyticus]|uniref:conjugal transfer protein TraN n=1 Tax=Vibrio parahaemolyticus TaxID=670 RepID=UPI0037513C9A|nr:conjugal transfer protein TraN [Vibrio parahaemolyticus]